MSPACECCNARSRLKPIDVERLPGRERATILLCTKCLRSPSAVWRLRRQPELAAA